MITVLVQNSETIFVIRISCSALYDTSITQRLGGIQTAALVEYQKLPTTVRTQRVASKKTQRIVS